ncbi:NAD-dependent epimerase/dehydratase family protein [Acuticoccus yangtzensis]|uniref:NAD-dependent epimerase/dehydratase family protein n=1 Tax=Acuticoccus yangtzensis TaxID=1443441 RepID=UPI0009496ADE|nr:NAD(P)-dependent oxidoreductase [Acuticoccus yangtzensis]ORE95363.1 NAD-dependent epimerase/dehydratase [Stappia sp. 22II-S9-Z10]
MKHILIGGDGFVGRHLAPLLLADGAEVVVVDVTRSDLPHYADATHITCDIRDADAVRRIPFGPDDIVHNLAAKMLSPLQKRRDRHAFFWPTNFTGASNVLDQMRASGAHHFIQFTTDMIYGHTVENPQTESHPRAPLGEYGASKLAIEERCEAMRAEGMMITIMRPRLIIGPGRLGILAKLFKLIDANLPVPMIGSGKHPYQFVSVYDCAQASYLAAKYQCPNAAYNLGSKNPPSVRALLGSLIKAAGSRSVLVPTPGPLVKLTLAAFDRVNLPIMDPEQYLIADEYCVRDTTAIETDLGWRARHDDSAMLNAAYAEYRGHPVPEKASAEILPA